MASIDVKCRFCNQTDDVKKHGTCVCIIKDIDVNLAEKPFRLTILIVPVSLESKNRLLSMNNAGIRDTARALHISINAVVRALKNFFPVV